MTKYVVAARIDERGRANSGRAGDQTGRELCVHTLSSSGSWVYILRPPSKADIMVKQAYAAAANNKIGYDQYQRTTLYARTKNNNWDISKVRGKCECDCSSLIAVLCNCAGFRVSKDIYTGNQISALKAKGFRVLKYKSSRLKPGDVLWRGSHTAIYVGTSKTYSGSLTSKKINVSYPTMIKSYANLKQNLTVCSDRRKNKTVKYIVIHETGSNTSAKNNCIYFGSKYRGYSADFFIDKNGSIYKYNGNLGTRYSWHCNDGNGKYGITNKNSIGIEVVSSGVEFTQKQKNALNKLVRALMSDFDIPKSKIKRHYDASRKLDPAAYCGTTVKNNKWTNLRNYITKKQSTTTSTTTNNKVSVVSTTASTSSKTNTLTKKYASATAKNNKSYVTSSSKVVSYAKFVDTYYKRTYTVDSEKGLNMRYNAGITNKIVTCVPNGESVTCYGYYTKSSGVKWLLVEYVKEVDGKNVTYIGYMNINWLKKI